MESEKVDEYRYVGTIITSNNHSTEDCCLEMDATGRDIWTIIGYRTNPSSGISWEIEQYNLRLEIFLPSL